MTSYPESNARLSAFAAVRVRQFRRRKCVGQLPLPTLSFEAKDIMMTLIVSRATGPHALDFRDAVCRDMPRRHRIKAKESFT